MSAEASPAGPGILGSRIGRRFVALFTGCALLPLVVFAWLVVTHTTEQMRVERTGALHGSAKTAGMGIAARLSQVAGDLALARELASPATPGSGIAAARLLPPHVGERCASVWVDRRGTIELLCGEAPPVLPPLGAGQLQHLAAGKQVVCAVGEPPQLVMVRALDPAMPAAGLVAVCIRPRWFWDADELRSAGGEVGVFDGHWRPLFHTFDAPPDTRPFARAVLANGSAGTVEWAVGGEPHFARYWRAFLRPQYDLDLFVVQSHPSRAAFQVGREFTWWFVATAASTLLLVLLVSLVQMRRTLGPIVLLHEATRRLSAGDLGARVVVRGRDELGELGAAFNDMAARLQENIRRREQTERDLVASRDAALAAAHAKAEFVTNVSHELRTPMTELLSATEILGQLEGGDDAVREEFCDIALRGAQRLARLVDDVLELGETTTWEMGQVDVEATLRAAADLLPPEVQARIRWALAPLPAVQGDAARLRDTWGRLLDNAAKFSPPGAPIDVRAVAGDGDVVVEIADRGVGIAPDDLARVFEPFVQVGRDQMTAKACGAGLGLSLARNAVERHGGRIEVDSAPGRGSTFRVRLPVPVPAPAPASAGVGGAASP